VVLTAALLLLANFSAAQAADTWPVFRGDSQSDGVSPEILPEQLEVLWKRTFKNAAFESTAVIAEGVVYLGGLDGYLRAIDLADGREKWHFHRELGFKAPAAVRDGAVYIGDSDGNFFCLDAATGKQRWQVATEAEINAGANFFGPAVLVGSQDGSLYALDRQSGKTQWKYSIDNMIQCTPTVIDNRAFIAGCDGKLHIIAMNASPASAEHRPTTSLGTPVTVDIQDPTGATPAAHGAHVYFGTQGSRFLCVDWQQAKIEWSFEPKRKQPFQSSAAVSGGLVVVGGRDRLVHGLDAKTGSQRWSFPTRGRVDSSPVISGSRVFIGSSDGRLYGLDLLSGHKIWEYEAGGGFTSSPAVAGGRLVIANDDGDVYCFGRK
jgi:outer membrane protein assembly factor BamB